MAKQMLLRSFTTELAAACEAEANAQGVAFNTDYHQRAAELLLAREPLPYTFPKAEAEFADAQLVSEHPCRGIAAEDKDTPPK